MTALEEVCTEFWEWRLREWPEFATFCGDHRYDDKLNDHTEQAFLRRQNEALNLLEKCTSISPTGLSTGDQVSLQLLQQELNSFINGMKHKGYVFPLDNMDGIHLDFDQVISWMVFNNIDDYRKYIKRIKCLSKRLAEDKEMFKLGISIGKTFSLCCVDMVPVQLANSMKNPEKTVFYQPFVNCSKDFDDLEDLKREAINIIDTDILPAIEDMRIFMEQEYLPHCRQTAGVCGMTDGKKFYEHVLQWHTSLPLSPGEVHQIGLREVQRIRSEMRKVIKSVGFDGDFQNFLEKLRKDKSFYYTDKESLLQAFHDIAEKRIRPLLPQMFHSIPKAPLSIGAFDETKTSAPVAYYLAGTPDGSRPGKFYVNASNLSNVAKFDLMTLTLHEGEPGHHLQFVSSSLVTLPTFRCSPDHKYYNLIPCHLPIHSANTEGMHAIEATDIPEFRRYFEDMYYSLPPSHFSLHTAYGEGWGLYCEYLGRELGLYDDPYSMFGHLSYEMHRACRLVADTGLHYMGWDLERAVELLEKNTALSHEAALGECKRYCIWPGQACAYKLGQMKIQELRQHATEALGNKFDIKDFHEEVLKVGMVPLSILEHVIELYIQRKLSQ